MDPTGIGLLDLAEQRLTWLDRQQSVLARNVANANTPGYQPRDLRPFTDALANASAITPVQTQPNHLPGTVDTTSGAEIIDRSQTASLDGNAVGLDEQLVKVAEADSNHQLAATIYKTYMNMFNTALGRGSSS